MALLTRYFSLISVALFVSGVAVCHKANAQLTTVQLAAYERVIFDAPDKAYTLLLNELKRPSPDLTTQIWLLLRKAQAQETLTLYSEMQQTLNQVKQYRDEMSLQQSALFTFLSGIAAYHDGDISAAIALLTQAQQQLSNESPSTMYVLIVRELGYFYALSGDYYEANLLLHQQLNALMSHNTPLFNALLNESLGDTYNYFGNYPQSISYYTDALNTYRKLNTPPFIASTLLGLATVHRRLEQWEQALFLFDQYRDAVSYADNYSEHYFYFYGRAMTLAEQADCDNAILALTQALSLTGVKDYHAELYKKRALCHAKTGQLEAARQDLQNASDILNQMPELIGTQWQLELQYIEAQIEQQAGEFESALILTQAYFDAYTHLQRQNYSERLARLQTSLENDRKDNEILMLKQQQELQKEQMKSNELKARQQTTLLVSSLIALCFLLGFIALQHRHSQKLLLLSTHDELTGLYNRRFIFNYFEKRIQNQKSVPLELAVLIVDIDNFKAINDRWGHNTGDAVITTVAQVASKTLRANDIISRIGGDEFLIALPRSSAEQASDIAQRILHEMHQTHIDSHHGETLTVTLSIGIACCDGQLDTSDSIDDLVEKADQALYQSKRNGKNQFTLYTDVSSR